MEFKIDAKEQITVISPQSDLLSKQLTAELAVLCAELVQNGSQNFIVDLSLCQDLEPDILESLIQLSAEMYEQGRSFVLAQPPAAFMGMLKQEDAIDSLNYAPTFVEAADIVHMEILERDLYNDF